MMKRSISSIDSEVATPKHIKVARTMPVTPSPSKKQQSIALQSVLEKSASDIVIKDVFVDSPPRVKPAPNECKESFSTQSSTSSSSSSMSSQEIAMLNRNVRELQQQNQQQQQQLTRLQTRMDVQDRDNFIVGTMLEHIWDRLTAIGRFLGFWWTTQPAPPPPPPQDVD